MDIDYNIDSPTYNGPPFPSCILCYLCGELFRRPRILPCGHTFCSECLAKLKDEIVNSGQPHTTSTTSPDHQFMPSNQITPVSPERNYISVPIKSSQLQEVHNLSNGESSKVDKSGAVDSVELGADFRDICLNSSATSDTVVLRNPSSNQDSRKVLSRSDTYTANSVSRREISADRAPSRLSCGSEPRTKPCTQCGHLTPTRKRSPVHNRTSSFQDKNAKSKSPVIKGPRWDGSPQRKSQSALSPPACSFDQKHGKEMEPFVCPIPDCNYSMRLMNLARWSPRNKAIAEAVEAWKQLHTLSVSIDQSTQTEITHKESLLLSIPRLLVNDQALQPLNHRKRHSSMHDIALDHAISVDGLQRGYLPRGHFSWRSYAAMVGMNILHQIVNL